MHAYAARVHGCLFLLRILLKIHPLHRTWSRRRGLGYFEAAEAAANAHCLDSDGMHTESVF